MNLADRLHQIIHTKKTRLGIALDVTSQSKLLHLADLLGPEVCMIKTHVDILDDFTPDFGIRLRKLAETHQFLIFEDRKFADIGHTSALQYEHGPFRIADWADLINAHIIAGPGIIEGLKQVGLPRGRALLLLAEMSSSGTLAKGAYAKRAVALAHEHPDFVIGIIAQKRWSPRLLTLTPGVRLKPGRDALGQRYRTVKSALSAGSDVLLVGREIINAPDPLGTAHLYRLASYENG